MNGAPEEQKCACVAHDAYSCWGARYGFRSFDVDAIHEDGGPCSCICHEPEDEDDQ
jgi:hypothetical protein